MKVSFPAPEDLLSEAKDPIRVVVIMKDRISRSRKAYILFTGFFVVVTAKLNDKDIGEYVYRIGETISYDKERLKELAEKSLTIVEEVKAKIAEKGLTYLSGQYTKETMLGVRP